MVAVCACLMCRQKTDMSLLWGYFEFMLTFSLPPQAHSLEINIKVAQRKDMLCLKLRVYKKT